MAFLTKRDRKVVNCTRSHVKNNSKLPNFMKISRIEGYNGKYGSNPQGIREISDNLFEFDQSDDELTVEIEKNGRL